MGTMMKILLVLTGGTICSSKNENGLNELSTGMAVPSLVSMYEEMIDESEKDVGTINKILSDTVLYPAIIGKKAKFQTFHEFIDFCIQEISQLNIFKTKSGLDITPFKKKIDSTLEAFKIQINNLTPKEIVNQMVNDLEEKMNSNFKLFNDKLQDTRVENSHYSIEIQKKAEEMGKQFDNLMIAQKYINKKLEKIQNLEYFDVLSNEIVGTNYKINIIFDILKDLAAYHPEVKKNYSNELEKNNEQRRIHKKYEQDNSKESGY